MYNYLICAHDEYARKRALGYYTNGIKAAGEVGAKVMLTNCCGCDWNEDPERVFERAGQYAAHTGPHCGGLRRHACC